MSKRYVIVVAGGKGLRMGTDIPKQFLLVNGVPVLMHTLHTFHSCDPLMNMIVVLPRDQQAYWRELCHSHAFTLPHRVADGGETRFHSVQNGLALVNEDDAVVGVHDGVRPFVSPQVIERCYSLAAEGKAVVPVTDMIESVRRVDNEEAGTSHPVDRSLYKLVQTPQVFPVRLLKEAYRQPYNSRFTDDASVVEALGASVSMVSGNRENIKLTTPLDLQIASILAPCSI